MIKLGDLLLAKKLVSKNDLERALDEQKKTGEFLGDLLIRRRFVKEDDLMKALAEQYAMPYLKLKDQYIDWNLATKFSSSLVIDKKCMPLRQDDAGVMIAISNPLDAEAESLAEKEAKNVRVRWVLVSPTDMDKAIKTYRLRMAENIKKMLG